MERYQHLGTPRRNPMEKTMAADVPQQAKIPLPEQFAREQRSSLYHIGTPIKKVSRRVARRIFNDASRKHRHRGRSSDMIRVYAQPTETNDRIRSLLTAVLQKDPRPAFLHAIRKKVETLHQSSPPGLESQLPPLGLVLVGGSDEASGSEDLVDLARTIKQFGRRYRLETAILSTTVGDVPFAKSEVSGRGAPSTRLLSKRLEAMLGHFSKIKGSVVLVAVGASGSDLVYQYLSSHPSTMASSPTGHTNSSNVLGVVALHPAYHEGVQFFSVPLFVVVSPSAVRAQGGDVLRAYAKENPRAILVEHDGIVDWNRSDLAWMWLGRTIAKYAEAVAQICERGIPPQSRL